MNKLFSPWRSKYIQTFSQPADAAAGCILCRAFQDEKDDEHLIVSRGKTSFVIMNLFPYNSGHVMVVPYRHTAVLTDLGDEESLEIMNSIKSLTTALQTVSHPDGF